jgi:hypothetical protein
MIFFTLYKNFARKTNFARERKNRKGISERNKAKCTKDGENVFVSPPHSEGLKWCLEGRAAEEEG